MRSDEDVPLEALPGSWRVAHTKARFEKAFAWDLRQRGIHYFLPMRERVRMSGGRKRRVMEPLFSSYVFFCGDEQAHVEALRTNRLCQVIPVPEQARFIAELAAIDRVVRGEVALDPYPQLAVGRRGRITQGAMEGLEGVITERRDRSARLVLQVSMLGQGAALEIDADLLEPLDDPLDEPDMVLRHRRAAS